MTIVLDLATFPDLAYRHINVSFANMVSISINIYLHFFLILVILSVLLFRTRLLKVLNFIDKDPYLNLF